MTILKNYLYKFDPVIYPSKLWIGINPELETISKIFYGLDSNLNRIDITEQEYKHSHFSIAQTYTVSHKKDGWIGTLVCIWRPKQLDIKTICHESAHCADFICENFGIETGRFDSGEPYAYMIGWIADCIEKVKLNKAIEHEE
jgi:hypothetical protein